MTLLQFHSAENSIFHYTLPTHPYTPPPPPPTHLSLHPLPPTHCSPDFPSVVDAVLQGGVSAVVELSQDIFLSSLHGLDTPTLPLAKLIPMVTDIATGVVQDSGQGKVIQVGATWDTAISCC